MFEFERLSLDGAFAIHCPVFHDDRGFFRKIIHEDEFKTNGLRTDFKEHYLSQSKKDVLRGMHFQAPPHEHVKLVYCAQGSAIDVLVDIRKNSPTYGKFAQVELSEKKAVAVYVPIGLAHGFLAKEDGTIMVYNVTSTHAPSADMGILWNSFGMVWPVKNPELSDRDRNFPPLSKISTPFAGGAFA